MAFIGGLLLLGVQVLGDADPMPLGPPIPSFVAAALALVGAVALASPTVRWLGGKDAVDTIVKRDAALRVVPLGALSGVVGDAMDRTARDGMTSRDQRIMFSFLLFFPLFACFVALANFVNGTFGSATANIVCQVTKQVRNPKSQRVEATFSCTLPGGEPQRANGIFDAELPPLEGPVPASQGALGVWLLPKSAVQR